MFLLLYMHMYICVYMYIYNPNLHFADAETDIEKLFVRHWLDWSVIKRESKPSISIKTLVHNS